MPTPEQLAVAVRTAEALAEAPRGSVGPIVQAACARAGCSPQSLHLWMKPYRVLRRKRRADYVDRQSEDELSLSRAEADLIGATIAEAIRNNDKATMGIKKAVRKLRADGLILAAQVDRESGEIGRPLSDGAISRALTRYGVHPEQIKRPKPHQPKRTLHPNHEWQVDASVCVVYYLPGGGYSIEELDKAVHYKNKPHNLAAIEQFRVIRYVVADHCSGVVRWRYYPGSETGAWTVAVLCWAMAPKADPLTDPFQGVPLQIVVDPGATASGTVQRFCDRLRGCQLIVTKRKNPRAKGSVEKGNDLIECEFEGGLKFIKHRIRDFADLNAEAEKEQIWWNSTAIHTRHGKTRFAAWMEIEPQFLRLTEPEAVLRTLATEHPATPKVAGDLTVAYKRGDVDRWSARAVPGVNVGDRLPVLWSPLLGADGQGQAMAVTTDPETGLETYHPLEAVRKDANGFWDQAPISGEEFARMPETDYERNAKRLSQLASGTDGPQADELARRRKDFRPLADLHDGTGFNPYAEGDRAKPVTWLPRTGVEHRVSAPELVSRVLEVDVAALRLASRVRAKGGTWGPAQYAWLAGRWPQGVPEDALEAIADDLAGAAAAATVQTPAAGLRVVK